MKTSPPLLCAAIAGLLLLSACPLEAEGTAAKSADSKRSYTHKLALGDSVRIAIFGEDDLTQTARIDARGQVNLPLVQQVPIGGLTVEQAKAKIEEAYKEGRYLRNPQVTITVESYTPREVTVQGQVRSPQRIALPLESTYTITEVITKAGGLADIAKGSQVTVRRPMPDGSYKVFVVDVDRLLKGKSGARVEDDFLLEPDDIVYVPERLI